MMAVGKALAIREASGVLAPTAAAETVSLVFVESLRIAPWNARKTFDPQSLDGLVASIASQGLLAPLVVRESDGDRNSYEIVAGHRRYRAALKLNFIAVPCFVRKLSDDQAREVGLVDNLQREDVPALEEADAYNELKQRLGTPAAIAARVGKDVAYVTRRLQLVSLGEMPRKALAERLITIDHALLLARLGPDEQDANLKWALDTNAGIKESVETTIAQRMQKRDRWAQWEPESPLSLKNHIEEHVGRKLSRAPWDLEDATLLRDVPRCADCPSNTKANDSLFGDLAIDEATCENGGCFDAKRAAFVQLQIVKAGALQRGRTLGLPVLRISWKPTTVKPRWEKDGSGPSLTQTFKRGQWVEAKAQSCEHLRAAVTVDWGDDANRGCMGGSQKLRKPGELLTVCVAAKCKAHAKDWEETKKSSPGLRNEDSAAARAEREADAKAEDAIRVAQVRKALDRVEKLGGELLRCIVLRALDEYGPVEDDERFPGLRKAIETKKPDSPEFARAAACILFIGDDAYDLWAGDDGKVERGRKEFIARLKVLGYDASKAWDKPAEAKPTPKKAVKPAPKKPTSKPAKKAAKKGGRK